MPTLVFLTGLLFSSFAWSYPEFIGYKYSSCITCHFNGHGNGPLNDYGRALWSAEIAGRMFAGDATDEQLGESSHIFGKADTPWWIRPGIKSRGLAYQSDPGSSAGNSKFHYILMQAEVNAAIFFDHDQNFGIIGSYGYAPLPENYNGPEKNWWISREHYIRWQPKENWWLYLGMLDKVYGIRIINHTAYSRMMTGLAQNDQAHSLILQYINPNWELSFDVFAGNLYQDADLRQKGASTMFEYEIIQAWRLGLSALYSSNDYVQNQRIGVHSRYGLGYGSALLTEIGLITDTPKGKTAKTGYYGYAQATQRLVRGYHLFVAGQAYKSELKREQDDKLKAEFGFLIFPMARMEFRFELENGMAYNDDALVKKDTWTLLAQLHLSL